MKITSQELADWKLHPTTCKVFEYFRKLRDDLKENLSEGVYTFNDAGATAQKHADIIGICKAYKDVLNITYEDFVSIFELEKEEEDGLE